MTLKADIYVKCLTSQVCFAYTYFKMKISEVLAMPDGDVVRYGVGSAYQKPYEALCETYFSVEDVAEMVAKVLQKSLKRYRNEPVSLIKDVFCDIKDALSGGTQISLLEEVKLIDETAMKLQGHRRGMSLAVDTCKEYIMQIIEGENKGTITPLIRNYVLRVLDADFLESLPLLNHHNDANPKYVEQRLKDMRPFLDAKIEHIVSQLAKSGKVDYLRRQAKVKEASIDFMTMDISVPRASRGIYNEEKA